MSLIESALGILNTHWGHTSLRPSQAKVIQFASDGNDVIAVLPTGYGKSFGAGTPILMFDGTVKAVEDVKDGERVMGPDSTPRIVSGVHSGQEMLYCVTPKKGSPYVVNESHILSLKTTPQGGSSPSSRGGIVVNIPLCKWLSASKTFRHVHKGWRTGVEFSNPQSLHVDLPPYLLGVWLGDGTSAASQVTSCDEEIIAYLYAHAEAYGLRVRKDKMHYAFARGRDEPQAFGFRANANHLTEALRKLGVLNNKHIPDAYLHATRSNRLQLLAGLIDTDGSHNLKCPDLVFKSAQLATQTVYLARSLGFAAYMKPCQKKCQSGVEGTYYRIIISGHTDTIPVLVKRKVATARRQKKDVLVTGIKVEPIGEGKYYGFQVDKDHLFLLGDFTVVHNSAIFQIPAMMFEGSVLVVSPLIALMKDQVDDCTSRGIPASYINSHVADGEQAKRFENWKAGKYKVFYIAPERINNAQFREALGVTNISFVVIDEGHCASIWGHDFRPAYLRIRDLTDNMDPRPPVLVFTATATKDVVTDIALSVGLREDHKRVVADPVRPNLNYQVVSGSAHGNLMKMVKDWDTRRGRYVVYAGTRQLTQDIAEYIQNLVERDHCVGFYHAGLAQEERITMQNGFKSGSLPIMVATNAFGMGIDVPNIRVVVHYGLPGSLENYVQESGRAGRDGLHSDCYLLLDQSSVTLQQRFIGWANPKYHVYETVWAWLNENLTPEELLLLGDTRLAEQMEGVTGNDVGAVLRTMAAYGLVERSPVPYGTLAKADLTILRKLALGTLPAAASVKKVAKACWDLFVLPATGGKPKTYLEFGIDRDAVAEAAGVSKSTISKNIGAIIKAGGWEVVPIDYTRTTRILLYQANLADALPKSVIATKRKRDQDRLDRMVEYANLPPGQHVPYIRNYFLGEEGVEE